MRVLVTGAQGCVGAWVVKRLLGRGIDVLAFDLDADPVRLKLIAEAGELAKVRFETGRLEDGARLKALVKDGQVTHIVHLAAVLIPFCQANPAAGALVNVVGTLNVFEAARDAGRPVRVAYASSAAVWGPADHYQDRPLTEADKPHPATHYGVFKLANEDSARVFHSANGISSIGLRPWSVYGVGRDAGLTADATLAMRAAALGQDYRMRLTGYMDLQYVEDVAEAFVSCALAELPGAHVFNLAGEVVEMAALAELIGKLRPSAKGRITAEGPQVPVAFRMDNSALRQAFPDLPATPLEEGTARTIELFERLGREGRIH